MAKTSIEWTDATWNPVRGCSFVSPGCTNCYAMKQAHRMSGPGGKYEGLTRLGATGPIWTGKVRLVREKLEEPLGWRKPRCVFVNSMSDLFHEDVPFDFIDEVFAIMAIANEHTYQVLTKRVDRAREWAARAFETRPTVRCIEFWREGDTIESSHHYRLPWPLPNVWLGVSVEDQKRADERIPHLLRTPAAVRFLSVEPLLGPVDLRKFCPGWQVCNGCGSLLRMPGVGHAKCDCGWQKRDRLHQFGGGSLFPLKHLHWVIVGGESGPGARPCDADWIRSIIAQCRAAKVPVFVKQLGARPIEGEPDDGPEWPVPLVYGNSGYIEPELRDKKGGDPSEWPEDLRIREFPKLAHTVA